MIKCFRGYTVLGALVHLIASFGIASRHLGQSILGDEMAGSRFRVSRIPLCYFVYMYIRAIHTYIHLSRGRESEMQHCSCSRDSIKSLGNSTKLKQHILRIELTENKIYVYTTIMQLIQRDL